MTLLCGLLVDQWRRESICAGWRCGEVMNRPVAVVCGLLDGEHCFRGLRGKQKTCEGGKGVTAVQTGGLQRGEQEVVGWLDDCACARTTSI